MYFVEESEKVIEIVSRNILGLSNVAYDLPAVETIVRETYQYSLTNLIAKKSPTTMLYSIGLSFVDCKAVIPNDFFYRFQNDIGGIGVEFIGDNITCNLYNGDYYFTYYSSIGLENKILVLSALARYIMLEYWRKFQPDDSIAQSLARREFESIVVQ